jgi:hypothetical protein
MQEKRKKEKKEEEEEEKNSQSVLIKLKCQIIYNPRSFINFSGC